MASQARQERRATHPLAPVVALGALLVTDLALGWRGVTWEWVPLLVLALAAGYAWL